MKMFLYTRGNDQSHKEIGEKLRELKDGDYVIIVKKNRPIRSLKANGYYHIIVKLIATHTNHTHEQIHEICKYKFNHEVILLPKGGSQIIGKSTGRLDTKEFAAFVNRVKQWGRDEFNLIIPEPEDITVMREIEIENQYTKHFSGW